MDKNTDMGMWMLKILIVMALSLICAMTVAADDTIDGNALFLRMSGISVKEMEYLADSALKSGDEKRAVSIYMYLCDRRLMTVPPRS